jgi:hypothetical protein
MYWASGASRKIPPAGCVTAAEVDDDDVLSDRIADTDPFDDSSLAPFECDGDGEESFNLRAILLVFKDV